MFPTRWRPQPTSGTEAFDDSEISDVEWQVVLSGRAHVLIEGRRAAVRRAMSHLMAQLPRPISTWHAGAPWPSASETVVVEEVDRLDPAEQRELLERVSSRSPSVQVVSTSSRSVYSAVCRGDFRTELYYHLNTVRIELR